MNRSPVLVGLAACGAFVGCGTPGGGGDDDVVQGHTDAPHADNLPGSVTIGSYDFTVMNTTLHGVGFSAEFYTAQPAWPHAPDTGCALVVFPPSPTFPPKASAGAISFATSPAVQLVPDGSATYTSVTTDHVLPANQAITVSASGGEVPAFSGTVTMPARAVLAGPITTIDRSHDLAVHWTGGSGMLRFDVVDASAMSSTRVICAFPAVGGSGTVPTALLGQLPAGNAVIGASVTVRSDVEAGAWTVEIVATTSVVWPDLSPASAMVTLQ